MIDLISREAAIEELCADCSGKCIPCEAWPCDEIKVIQNLPAAEQFKCVAQINVDPDEIIERIKAEAKTGRWIYDMFIGAYRCSECNGKALIAVFDFESTPDDFIPHPVFKQVQSPFCPHCGAALEEVTE